MQLHTALGLKPQAMVAAVGAGGKTALLQRLAGELAAQGACVISTTTTAIWEPEGLLVVLSDEAALLAATAALAGPGKIIAVAGGRRLALDEFSGRQRSKLAGVPPDTPARLVQIAGVDYVLVEADGARGRGVKGPAAHEPVIPAQAGVVLAVVGIEALGEPLDGAIAHRPEIVAALLGIAAGTPLNPRHLAALLAHPQGGRKGVPPAARFYPFINKVQDTTLLLGARAIAGFLRGREPVAGIERVLIGAALAPEPVMEVW